MVTKNAQNPEYSPMENNAFRITRKIFLQKPGYLNLVARLSRDKY